MASPTAGKKKSAENKDGEKNANKGKNKNRTLYISIVMAVCGALFIIVGVCLYSLSSPKPSADKFNFNSSSHPPSLPNTEPSTSDDSLVTSKPETTMSTTANDVPAVTFDPNKFPPLSSKPRIPIVDASEPTFEIVNAIFSLKITTVSSSVALSSSSVTFELNVIKRTEKLSLRCAVEEMGNIIMYHNGKFHQAFGEKDYEKNNKLLVFNLTEPVETGKIKVDISYTPSGAAFDKFSYPCDKRICIVFANRHPHLLVPHFDHLSKHIWEMKLKHPTNVKVLTNSKTNKTEANAPTIITTFDRTQPLLPSELTFVISDNLIQSSNGTQVESYIPKGNQIKEVRGLVDTLEKALSSNKGTSGEVYYVVVIPAMKSYRFSGKNLAIVGENLLMSNEENKLIFAWIWIFRMVLYKKVTSSDTNPTWIYDHSAYFLATSTKSQNPDIWRKHLYEIALEVDHSGMKQSIAYQDETRYFATHQHMAKISTLLSMMTTMDSTAPANIIANMDGSRDTTNSDLFFFLKKKYDLQSGVIMVDTFMLPYLDSPDLPQVGISRVSKSHVLIQRYSGEQAMSCDIHLALEEGAKKKQNTLAAGVEKVEIEATSPLLLSGKSPFSSYGYTLAQSEFDRLQDSRVLDSFYLQTLNLLASNAFKAAFEGRLNYVSLQRFIARSLKKKAVSVDDVIDLWSSTIRQSRDEKLKSHIRKVVESTIKMAGSGSGQDPNDYILKRFESAVQKDPEFLIEKAKKLLKDCGDVCFQQMVDKYDNSTECIDTSAKDCSYNPHVLEMYTCAKVAVGPSDYDHFVNLYNECKGKACQMPVLRGLLCTTDKEKLQNHLNTAITFDKTRTVSKDFVEGQVVEVTFEGLASNDDAKPLLFAYLVDKWPQLYEMFYTNPSLLGTIVNSLASTINTQVQLNEYKQFLQAYKETVEMFREFQEQVTKAKKVVIWQNKFSKEFESSFTIDPLSYDTTQALPVEGEQATTVAMGAEESENSALSQDGGSDYYTLSYFLIIIGGAFIVLGGLLLLYTCCKSGGKEDKVTKDNLTDCTQSLKKMEEQPTQNALYVVKTAESTENNNKQEVVAQRAHPAAARPTARADQSPDTNQKQVVDNPVPNPNTAKPTEAQNQTPDKNVQQVVANANTGSNKPKPTETQNQAPDKNENQKPAKEEEHVSKKESSKEKKSQKSTKSKISSARNAADKTQGETPKQGKNNKTKKRTKTDEENQQVTKEEDDEGGEQ